VSQFTEMLNAIQELINRPGESAKEKRELLARLYGLSETVAWELCPDDPADY